MKKINCVILITLLLSSLILVSCAKKNSENVNNSAGTDIRYEISGVDPDGNLGVYDTQVVFNLCKDYIDNYYHAMIEHSKFDPSMYMRNKNLINFSNIKYQYNKYKSSNKVKEIYYGVSRIEWHKSYVSLQFNSCIEITLEDDQQSIINDEHLFIVNAVNDDLKIVDWYTRDYFDLELRGEDVKMLNEPDLWEDKRWSSNMLLKAQTFITENQPTLAY